MKKNSHSRERNGLIPMSFIAEWRKYIHYAISTLMINAGRNWEGKFGRQDRKTNLMAPPAMPLRKDLSWSYYITLHCTYQLEENNTEIKHSSSMRHLFCFQVMNCAKQEYALRHTWIF